MYATYYSILSTLRQNISATLSVLHLYQISLVSSPGRYVGGMMVDRAMGSWDLALAEWTHQTVINGLQFFCSTGLFNRGLMTYSTTIIVYSTNKIKLALYTTVPD